MEVQSVIKNTNTVNKINSLLSKKISIISLLLSLFVILIHNANLDSYYKTTKTINITIFLENLISNSITRMAVPMFFIMSGYLFFVGIKFTKELYIEKLKKRVHSLLIPYLLWNFFGYIFWLFISKLPLNGINTAMPTLSVSSLVNSVLFH